MGIVLGMDLPCHLAGIFGWDSVDPNKRESRKTPGGLGVTSKQPPPCFSLDWFFEKMNLTCSGSAKIQENSKRGAQFSLERSLLAYDQKLATGFPTKIFTKKKFTFVEKDASFRCRAGKIFRILRYSMKSILRGPVYVYIYIHRDSNLGDLTPLKGPRSTCTVIEYLVFGHWLLGIQYSSPSINPFLIGDVP